MLDCPVKNGAMGIGRHDGVRLHDGYLRLLTNFTASKEIDASIVSDPKQPRCQGAVLIKRVVLSIGLEERVLNHSSPSNTDPVIREQ